MNESTPSHSLGAVVPNVAVRRFIYSAYVIALLVVGATQVALTSLGGTNPDWLIATLAVLGYLGVPVAGLAVANTSTNAPAADPQPEGTTAATAPQPLQPAVA